MILDKINSPVDLKTLSIEEMNVLATEMRELIIKKVNVTGGHMAPNLGILETTIALHYVFNSPEDKFVFDVSHQCYPHKILTGRKDGFIDEKDYLKYTGYTAPEESAHDMFKIGHTSTSISLATGLVKARDLNNENYNVIALIGDGSLSGGEALEGLNFASKLNSNFIIIVNDNQMSIAQNYGGLYDNLKESRETKGAAQNNFFKTLGYDYCFIEEGNNIEKLVEEFKKIKDINHPLIVHLVTEKGHGLKAAVDNKEKFHWVMPNVLDENAPVDYDENYTSITVDYFLKKAKQDPTFAVVNAATPGAFGLVENVRKELGKQFIDVAIAEEHAIGMISGMAKNGAKPVFCVMSSFIQRTYDQLSQDLCLNSNPATILIYWGGITESDATHLTTFDIPMMSNIPNLVYLAPTTKEEYLAMLDWSVEQKEHPVAIRVPNIELVSVGIEDKTDYSIINKYQVTQKGDNVAIMGLGNFYFKALEVAKLLKVEGINATIINPKFITGVDTELMEELKKNHKVVVTLEDGELDGGWGEKIARYYGASNMKVLNYGSYKEFSDRVSLDELYTKYRLKNELILEDIKKALI
ncbi:MAG: 1-deoxy-D-xylulose-5-phosphate synthase [Candidatus Gastranaerophilales bacterium]|nr:1-deoxy-D-xylulose-5-phosphate synthase [Candidatus Gastranaerophilales bacterium]